MVHIILLVVAAVFFGVDAFGGFVRRRAEAAAHVGYSFLSLGLFVFTLAYLVPALSVRL